mmetsp:Transcript_91274/g.295114  ORF Transcript_91274/g.295114 Transcript_91274/m.295114 type:complete len:290 (-) Transcript_91274:349-1218(-)
MQHGMHRIADTDSKIRVFMELLGHGQRCRLLSPRIHLVQIVRHSLLLLSLRDHIVALLPTQGAEHRVLRRRVPPVNRGSGRETELLLGTPPRLQQGLHRGPRSRAELGPTFERRDVHQIHTLGAPSALDMQVQHWQGSLPSRRRMAHASAAREAETSKQAPTICIELPSGTFSCNFSSMRQLPLYVDAGISGLFLHLYHRRPHESLLLLLHLLIPPLRRPRGREALEDISLPAGAPWVDLRHPAPVLEVFDHRVDHRELFAQRLRRDALSASEEGAVAPLLPQGGRVRQ